ncbi:MAG: hypothetical protein QM773_09600 [Hyphomonadaceae bacterium]
MKYALAALPLLFAAPAFAQEPQQPDRPLIWSGKERLIRPADGLNGLYREPYTGGGALNRGPYTGGGQLYDLIPQPDQGVSRKTDWSKPVTGVDGLVLPAASSTEEVTLPVIVVTQDQTAQRAADDTPLPPPCEPPVTKANSAKPPPAPCPLPPR